jgi:hypothetical protein
MVFEDIPAARPKFLLQGVKFLLQGLSERPMVCCRVGYLRLIFNSQKIASLLIFKVRV